MASRRGNTYETKCDSDEIENLSERLTQDLRIHIRELGSFPILSDSWIAMADNLGRMANITEMEQNLPKETAEATLWECEELALRYILEDGKLNLCLRNLVEYKEYERDARSSGRVIKPESRTKMDSFERGLGTVLKNAWSHVEALQTTDLPLLIGHIAAVMNDAVATPEVLAGKEVRGRQEVLVLHYLLGLSKRMDDIDESRVMPLIMDHKLMPLIVKHLHCHHAKMARADVVAGAQALALLCDTEDFQTHKAEYVSTDEEKSAFMSLRADFLNGMEEDSEQRRAIRPLLDFVALCVRQMGK